MYINEIIVYKMIDIINYQLFGFPVLMYGAMIVTIGALTVATVGLNGVSLPSIPSASGLSPPIDQYNPAQSTPTPQGGRKRKNTQKKHKSHSGSKKNSKHK